MILDLGEQKKQGRIGKLFVMGCLSERFMNDLIPELPEVDRFYGKFNWKELIADLGKAYHQELSTERHTEPLRLREDWRGLQPHLLLLFDTYHHRSL